MATPPLPYTPLAWAELLYQGAQAPAGLIEYRLGPEPMRARAWMPWPNQDDQPFTICPKWRRHNAYFGVALRTLDAEAAGKGDKAHTHPTHLVFNDLDLKGSVYLHGDLEPERMAAQELREAAEAAFSDLMGLCEELNLPPRAVVYSGHGLQVYWARREATSLEDTEAFNRGLAKRFEADPVSTDQARILRLPGTLHLKNPDRPLEVEVWHADPAAVVEDADLEPLALRRQKVQSGERFINDGSVQDADLETLRDFWGQLKNRPVNGLGRHYLALYVAGWLRSNSYSEADASDVVQELASSAGDEELGDRLRAVRESYRADSPRGWFGLSEDFGLQLQGIPIKPAAAMTLTPGKSGKKQPARARNDKDVTLVELASLFLDHCATSDTPMQFAHHEAWGEWFQYTHGVYVRVPERSMVRIIDTVLQEHGYTNLSGRKLRDVLLKISHTPDVARQRVDQTAWELNVQNGILDLRTLELRDHSPEFFSIVQSPVRWDPSATCPAWGSFLRGAVPDDEMRGILQRYAGYCLTGDMSAQKALFLIGEGGTGKGTFMHVLEQLLGGDSAYSLAGSAPLEAIKDGSPQVEVLVGKRLCVISEISRHVNWEAFKRITGQDALQVNPKFRDAYNVRLETKLVILSNVLPHLGEDASNTALTRRFMPVSFNVKAEAPDPDLRQRLTTPAELAGVLVWAVKGLRELVADHMQFGQAGDAGLARDIVEQSNRVITFLEERCANRGEVKSSELYKAYQTWCADTGHRPVTSTRFATDCVSAARILGWTVGKEKGRSWTIWQGITALGVTGW